MTDFQKQVYAYVRTIRKGYTKTYKEVACAIGRPRAYRAVGNALHKNYDPHIPCHRVILSNGKPGGYNRGMMKKQKILADERI